MDKEQRAVEREAEIEQASSHSSGAAPQPSRVEPPEDPPVPGHRNYLIFCDETGTHGAVHYAFGTFWIRYERRGDLYRVVGELRDRHGYVGEIKWNKVSRASEPFYRDLLIAFFKTTWMMFHTLIVRKGYVDRAYHDGDYDLARRKHFTMLLGNKIARFNDGATDKSYHVRVDPIASYYPKADEVVHKISNYVVKNAQGVSPVKSFRARDSKESLGIQLCDFLLGATLASWQGEMEADHKKRIASGIGSNPAKRDRLKTGQRTARRDWGSSLLVTVGG